MNSAKFRIQSAYANPGTRPAFKIAQEQAKLRYMYSTRKAPLDPAGGEFLLSPRFRLHFAVSTVSETCILTTGHCSLDCLKK